MLRGWSGQYANMDEKSSPVSYAKKKEHRYSAALIIISLIIVIAGCVPYSSPPTPTLTLEPTQTTPLLPDLRIVSAQLEISGNRNCADPLIGLQIKVVIRNRGQAPVDGFDLIVDGEQYSQEAALSPGETLELLFPATSERATIQLDPSNQIMELNEGNNEYMASFILPTLPEACLPTPTPVMAIEGPIVTLEGHKGPVLSVAFSPDGSLIASGSVDNTVRLWRVYEENLLRTMTGHTFPVQVLDFSPNGVTLVTGSTDGLVRAWQVSNGQLTRSFIGHAGKILDIKFSADGRHLASSAEDFTVRIWNPSNGRLFRIVDEGMTMVNQLAFTADSNQLAWVEEDGSIRFSSVMDGGWIRYLHDLNSAATSIAISPDQALLAVGYEDGRLQLWSLPEGDLIQTIAAHRARITGLEFSGDERWLASSSKDSRLRLWELVQTDPSEENASPQPLQMIPVRTYEGHQGGVNCLSFSPRGDRLASAGQDGTVRFWLIPEN